MKDSHVLLIYSLILFQLASNISYSNKIKESWNQESRAFNRFIEIPSEEGFKCHKYKPSILLSQFDMLTKMRLKDKRIQTCNSLVCNCKPNSYQRHLAVRKRSKCNSHVIFKMIYKIWGTHKVAWSRFFINILQVS